MGTRMIGAMYSLMLFSGGLFSRPLYATNLVARYILKNAVLVAVGMVLAPTWSGARVVAGTKSIRSALQAGFHHVRDAWISKPSGCRALRRAKDYRS